jgi:flagellar M-ring protein FliF
MSPEDVMVVDSRGTILSATQNDTKLSKLTGSQVDFQRNMEKDLGGRIQSLLENIVGKGKAVVRVTAELDFRVTEKTEESYDAEAPVMRSVQRNSEKVNAVGKTGTVSENPEKEKLDEIVNYEINKVVNKTIMPVGDTKKLSIAVLVDGTYKKNEKGEEVYQARTKNEIESLEDLVRKSAGFNAQRGDQVVVTNMPFRKVDVEEAEAPSLKERVETFTPILGYVAIIGGIIFILLFIVRPLIKNIISAAPARSLSVARVSAGLSGETPTEIYARQVADERHAADERPLTEAEIAKEMAKADAKQFADILRNWLK